ncbi:hypothetical protein [Nocardioides lianchengensis]|uniref:Uncharacterized protein n=1 Tax=Nocardioides lianchengensis TaxID=1045774 RepID=A0A1G6ZFC7_9ACTN|nr:hypothetical protein [Nocardioides lianchengensis]NYG11406.1 hypothetical protein [Nocardioides lianchengensis]SDE01162.1 hypothetical protein SAMN05421872_113119 [Nocardioides lianchengensis]
MESDQLDPHEARRIAERAEAAPYVDYPPTPWWYPPAAGAWAAALVLTMGLAQDHPVAAVGIVALIAVESAFLGWYARYHGAFPSLRRAPAEFRPAFVRYVVGVVSVFVLVGATWWLVGYVAAGGVALVLVTTGLALYERAFAGAAERTRARLA